MTGAEGIGGGAAAYFASRAQSTSLASPASSLSGGEGAGGLSGGEGGGGASSNISPFAQLLSELQQLQAQNPTSFTQVVSQISSQLQSAAQQQGPGIQSTVLGNLANQFQNVATTGDLSRLQPHHHAHQGGGATYGSNGQPTSNGSGNSWQQTLQQLFSSFSSEVTSALGNGQ